jgi:hypothetical protein
MNSEVAEILRRHRAISSGAEIMGGPDKPGHGDI